MKNAWQIVLLVLTFAACSKSNDPTPDAGSQVAGSYTMSYIESDSAGTVLYKYTLPASNSAGTQTLSGMLTARRDSANAVFLTQTIKLTGQSDQTGVIGEINLRTNGAGYDMYLNNQKIGTADGKTISIDAQQTDATTGIKFRDVITAAK